MNLPFSSQICEKMEKPAYPNFIQTLHHRILCFSSNYCAVMVEQGLAYL
jgi:hypothetical protein